jgi:hypothetical protein
VYGILIKRMLLDRGWTVHPVELTILMVASGHLDFKFKDWGVYSSFVKSKETAFKFKDWGVYSSSFVKSTKRQRIMLHFFIKKVLQ